VQRQHAPAQDGLKASIKFRESVSH
jgi:hypothetical protein